MDIIPADVLFAERRRWTCRVYASYIEQTDSKLSIARAVANYNDEARIDWSASNQMEAQAIELEDPALQSCELTVQMQRAKMTVSLLNCADAYVGIGQRDKAVQTVTQSLKYGCDRDALERARSILQKTGLNADETATQLAEVQIYPLRPPVGLGGGATAPVVAAAGHSGTKL